MLAAVVVLYLLDRDNLALIIIGVVLGAILGPLGVVVALPWELVCYVLAESIVYVKSRTSRRL